MSVADYLRELVLPVRSPAVLLTLVLVALATGIVALTASLHAMAGLVLMLLFALCLLPGLARYLVQIAEDRAQGRHVDPPTAEQFMWLGSLWPLTSLLLLVAVLAGVWATVLSPGVSGASLAALLLALVFPASVGVLLITHAPLQSLNPGAWWRYIRAVGGPYGFAAMTGLAIVVVPTQLARFSPAGSVLLAEYLVFASFLVAGRVTFCRRLLDEIDIPAAAEPDEAQRLARLTSDREHVLGHAYALMSRGNRDGGLRYLLQELEQDPDPDVAWAWVFEQMLQWEQKTPVLCFAQCYLGRLLGRADCRRATKLMLRCHLLDTNFRPLSGDLPSAIAAAEECRNTDLVERLVKLA